MFGLNPMELMIFAAGLLCLAFVIVPIVLLVKYFQKRNANPNLIRCPDCGRQVSRIAESCPGCGRLLG